MNDTLEVSPRSGTRKANRITESMERAMGIEPTSEAWEASILPLNYARAASKRNDSITLRNCLKLLLVTTGHNSDLFEWNFARVSLRHRR